MSDSNSRLPRRIIGTAVVGFALLTGAFLWKQTTSTSAQPSDKDIAEFRGNMKPLKWQTASKTERTAAAATITGQLEAFKHNQWDKAVQFQSSALRSNFASSDQFRETIQNAYPEFAKYRSVSFGRARSAGDFLQMEISLVGADAVKVQAVYMLQKEAGKYRVQGVAGGISPGQHRPILRPQNDGALPA